MMNIDDTKSLLPGQVVSLRSNPSKRGSIVAIQAKEPEILYSVFMDNRVQLFYASQIEPIHEDLKFQRLSKDRFHAYLTALQIRYPGLSSLYSLNAARIDFIPYQFRPVLRFIRSDRPRLLIADGVGVGKTIEAGLILRELQARSEVHSVLIICPRPLVIERKWQMEMKKFEEDFVHIDGKDLRYCISEMDLEGEWPDKFRKIILPYSLFDEELLLGEENKKRRKLGLLELDPPPRFDLVIVDEAHHIRNENTFRYKAVRFFCDQAEAVVFLTATPIQLGNKDLFVLLHTLRPDIIIDEESFSHITEPNPFINQAVSKARAGEPGWASQACELLNHAAATAWGKSFLKENPEYNRILNQLSTVDITPEDRVSLIADIEAFHTLSNIINRTRRRDISDFTIRKPETIEVEFTPQQRQIHDSLLQIQAKILTRIHGERNIPFMMTTIRRQAASCIFGLAPFVKEILERRLDELDFYEIDNTADMPNEDSIECIQSQIEVLIAQSRMLDDFDPKFEALKNIICKKQEMPNNKVMVFSSFIPTLKYLNDRLLSAEIRVGMIYGKTPDEERVTYRECFEMHREEKEALDVLLFSEIGCEGLDYQFCDCMVNYDLPWNPMRIEQRIGRIDRKGQKSETVAIYNMITPGTIDADIYYRCLTRIGIFEQSLGESEEILGEITKGIQDIAENFRLSETDRGKKLQQLADNKIRLIQEQKILEDHQLELFGIRLQEAQWNRVIDEVSSYWLSSVSLQRLVADYLACRCEKDQGYILGDKFLKTLRLSQENRENLLQDFQSIPRDRSTYTRIWEKYLKGDTPLFQITFDSECASRHNEAAFLTSFHPLVKQAAHAFKNSKNVFTSLQVKTDTIPPGHYAFIIYQWQYQGIRDDCELKPITLSETLTVQLPQLLITANEHEELNIDADTIPWHELETRHHAVWSKALANHKQRNEEIVNYQKESLKISHHARLALLKEQYAQASNDKIRKMHESQIASADVDYTRHIKELDKALTKADIKTEPVVWGILLSERLTNNLQMME